MRTTYFETAVARLLDIPPEWVVATDSCTTALAAAGRLVYLEVDNDNYREVRVCPLTWPATYAWAEDRPRSPGITWVTWADWGEGPVDVGVELWGLPWENENTPKILDAAHRFGDPVHAEWLQLGAVEAVCYSFAPQKEVACWMGGALVSPRAGEVRTWLRAGAEGRVYQGEGGVKGLLPDVAAAWLLQQVKHHERYKARRQVVLDEYERHLGKALLTRPGEASGHLCVVDAGSPEVRRLWRAALEKKPSIQWGHHYPLNEEQRRACPNAAALSDRILTLPCHVAMTRWDVRRVCQRLLWA